MALMISQFNEKWVKEATEYFAIWDRTSCSWKSFDSSRKDLLRNFVGLVLFGIPDQCRESVDALDLKNVWPCFPKAQRVTITEITEKLQFEDGHVIVSHTYLCLDNRSTICILRQLKSNKDILFFDSHGRVYNSWLHFCNTNRLPSCKYLAPDDGLHKAKQRLIVYTSPEATTYRRVQRVTDKVVAACTLGTIGLGLTSVALAPFISMVIGTVGTAYCVARSIGGLRDRSSHQQSIALNNAESAMAWANIATSAVFGATSVALSKSAQIVEASGKYGNVARVALKGCNYAAMTSSLCNIGACAYAMGEKIANGEKLTSYDYLVIIANVFVAVGCVANARQMNEYINSLENAPTSVPERLTRTVKRRLQRQRAKARREGVTSTKYGADVKEVSILDEDIPGFSLGLLVNAAGQQFINRHVNIQSVYLKCLEIWETCKDFKYEKIGLVVFASNMINHVQNLIILVSEALTSIKTKAESFLNQYFPSGNAPNVLVEQIGHMIENTTTAVKRVNERSPEEEEEDESQSTSAENNPKIFEIILEAAKNRIPATTKTSQVISEFSNQLSALIDEIVVEANNSYEEFVSKNIELLGKTEAEEIFSNMGIKTLNDFTNLNFDKIMKSKNNTEESIESRVTDDGVIQNLFTAYERLLSKVHPQDMLSELDALGSCLLLKLSLTEFFNPLGEKFNKASDLYDISVSYFDHSTVMKLVHKAMKVTSPIPNEIDDLTVFSLATRTLNFDEIAESLSATIGAEKRTNSSQLDDENVHTTVLLLCDKFYRKVESMIFITVADRERRIKDCYRYLLENFAAFIEAKNKERNNEMLDCPKLENSPFSNQQSFIEYYRKVNEFENHEIFASAVEHFTEDNNLTCLAARYVASNKVASNFHVPVCDQISQAEDGMRIYSINEGTYSNLRAYKSTAAKVFGLNEYNMELLSWEKGAVILKCGYDKQVIFQNVDTKSMIVMEIDTTKEPSVR